MIKKVLGRSLGGTAVAGLVLTAAPMGLSPSFVPMACEYVPDTTTSTSVTLLPNSFAPFGTRTTAKVTVTSGSNAPVNGKIRLVVNGNNKGLSDVVNGQATRMLPRKLVARKTHKIRIDFVETCAFGGSSATANYTVFRAKTASKARIGKARAAKFRARVIGSTGLVVRKGKVLFVVRNVATGNKVRSSVRRVRAGVARTDMKNLRAGQYKLIVRYLGSQNWKVSKGKRRFAVR